MVCPIFDMGGVMANIAISGGTALSLFFAYKVKFPSTLFSYHPTLLGFGWLALTPFAIKYLKESKKETKKEAKIDKVQKHGYINTVVIASTIGGLFAIWRNKELMAASKKQVAKHLVSLHAKVGAAAAALALLAFSTSLYKTYIRKVGTTDYTWKDKLHRWLGILSYLTSGLAILLIVNGPWGKFNLGRVGMPIVSTLIVSIQSLVFGAFLFA
uniref:Cytochrome b561 domain-containing protein n=1 Tax=Cryptomonas curvata TaxID=233186 RepID=A0A7S0M9S9_9CRYP|mmetsp:Transcript_3126/g.6840  ORF Transcript_3126/g.6840 Transcript_3126/m.6840 type:complete len:213 (+) Transcript_3126:38-676(+)